MRRLRISGLVGLAKRVRQELAGPVSPERLAQLRWDIEDAVKTIEKMLRDKSVRAQDLPLPSKKAYQFLKGLNLNTIVAEGTSSVSRFAPESVSFRGLKSHFDGLLNEIAQSKDPAQLKKVYESIVSASESIEDEVRAQNVRPEQLRKPARDARLAGLFFPAGEFRGILCRRAEGGTGLPCGRHVAGGKGPGHRPFPSAARDVPRPRLSRGDAGPPAHADDLLRQGSFAVRGADCL